MRWRGSGRRCVERANSWSGRRRRWPLVSLSAEENDAGPNNKCNENKNDNDSNESFVSVSVFSNEKNALIEVSDNGLGMKESITKEIFKTKKIFRFYSRL